MQGGAQAIVQNRVSYRFDVTEIKYPSPKKKSSAGAEFPEI